MCDQTVAHVCLFLLLNPHNVLNAKAYSELCQTCKMERFAKIVNTLKSLIIFAKPSIEVV